MGQGGGRHRGVSEKKFSGRLRRPKNFSPAPPPGGENFFSVGGLFSRPGGDFAQKSQKMASPGGQNFFSPGCFAPRGAPPPCFFRAGCRAIFRLKGGGCTPTTVGCPSTGGCWKLEIMHFYGYNAHVRTPLDELSAKLTKIGSHIPLMPIYTRKTAKKGAIFRLIFT